MLRGFTAMSMVFASCAVLAETPAGFHEDGIYLDLRGGQVWKRSGSVMRDLENGQKDSFTGQEFGYTTFLRGNSDQIIANAAANSSAPDLSITSRNLGFGFEYGLFNYLGIGFSILDERMNVRNIRSNISSDQTTLVALATAYPSASSAAYNQALINLEFLDPTVRVNRLPYLHATTVNFQMRFHPLNGTLDPYAGFSLGIGRESQLPTNVLRPALHAGLRVLTRSVYTGIELEMSFLEMGRKGTLPIPPHKQLTQTQFNIYAGLPLE
ncbi:MAG TPA: hypothetical protein PKE49_16145 [Leptospiraceae bacterium]|nr:hypothetical protein [Leptospirales bacterium]HMU82550.1 hypothetical protein [Leptospiraceae bacterium]HMX58055.1 hypothetical protein [Leptospiraceae bacterium]HMZ35094.1 hypothetical protein [Leptospiraceae bacterium]HNJ35431.1 hypothetical protein [Leptospiraceae bacterium]